MEMLLVYTLLQLEKLVNSNVSWISVDIEFTINKILASISTRRYQCRSQQTDSFDFLRLILH